MKHFNTTHWLTGTKFYRAYQALKKRCTNKNYEYYHRYWWRWIENTWNTFEEFYSDMYESYLKHIYNHWAKNTTLDRRDNDLNYSKSNCRWATNKTQARNRTWRCKLITYKWITKQLIQWSEDTWIKSSTIRMRLTYWWTIDKALGFEK